MFNERKKRTMKDAETEEDDEEEFLALLEEIEDNEMCMVCQLPLVKFVDNGMMRQFVCANHHITTVNQGYAYN